MPIFFSSAEHNSLVRRSPSYVFYLVIILSYLLSGCDATIPSKDSALLAIKNTFASPDQPTEKKTLAATPAPPLHNDHDLWQRIRAGYALSAEAPSFGQQRIESFLQRYQDHPKDIFYQTEQSSRYLYHIVSELEKNDLPMELALLPFVESRYDPFAYSSGRASGLWQFIPGTGKRFNLKENWWLDERRDIVASTQAAISYLTYLHKHFKGDWLLAIAAYNAGEGTVGKAVKRNQRLGKPIDFWALKLPKETQYYIPKLLAWAAIVKQPERYNLSLAPISNTSLFTAVDIGSQIDLATLADISAIDIEEIYALNPAYNRWATDPHSPHILLFPTHKVDAVKQSLQQYPIGERIQWHRYTIKANDSLSVIAETHNTTVAAIKSVNKLRGSTIRMGKTLLIPKASQNASYYHSSAEQRLIKRQASANGKNKTRIEHQVKTGDTFWGIAKHYQVSSSSIAHWNNMSVRDVLRNKQTLVIWTKKTSVKQTSTNRASSIVRKITYKVRQGDNLSAISQKFNVGIHDIRQWNKIHQQKYLKPGQNLRLYVSMADQGGRF
ncbi:MAG: membrane-bound lytic murein transglycosylase D [Candidatus Endobugula sp.]|jgi:membrane-bound lytic murein transglycosylase D